MPASGSGRLRARVAEGAGGGAAGAAVGDGRCMRATPAAAAALAS